MNCILFDSRCKKKKRTIKKTFCEFQGLKKPSQIIYYNEKLAQIMTLLLKRKRWSKINYLQKKNIK